MIINLCLVALFLLVLFRRDRWRPSWLATLAGAISLSTWGVFGVSAATFDSWIGGANWITLGRDIAATVAFWWYREAIGRAVGRAPFGSPRGDSTGAARVPWLLVALVACYTVPFALITEKGTTSESFVLDRLDQPTVWLFATLYMSTILLLSFDTLRLLLPTKGLLGVIACGYAVVIGGCLIEIGYLALTHFGVGGEAFRASMYYAAEVPFFTGVFTIAVAIAGTALRAWARYRWTLFGLLGVRRRADTGNASLWKATRVLLGAEPRRRAMRVLTQIQDDIGRGALTLHRDDHLKVEKAWLRLMPQTATRG